MGVDRLLDDPAVKRDYERYKRKVAIIEFFVGWMRRIPLVGRLIHTFWFALLDEGVYQTLKPRWGAITFSFLNDGFRPTAWHTWASITSRDPGLYVGRNPVDGERRPPYSKAEADLWDRLWQEQREASE